MTARRKCPFVDRGSRADDDDDEHDAMDVDGADAAFRECYDLVREMTKIYASDEDGKRVRAIAEHFEEIQKARAGREEHVANAVKEMSRRVRVAERKAVLPAAAQVARAGSTAPWARAAAARCRPPCST